jgi:murein DD-endopeptidase MepM/ murein hydrolase activator NlpD
LVSVATHEASCWLQPLARRSMLWFCCLACLAGCRGGSLPEKAVSPPKMEAASGVYHQVERGQTLWSIAKGYGVDVKMLARVNRLTNTAVLRVGQKLYIPEATQVRAVVSRCPCKSSAPPPASLSVAPPGSPAYPTALPRDTAKTKQPSLLWPLQGTIARDFQSYGRHRHDGIDIAAPQGTLIRAAADGKVLFSDWGPGGYGRIVILRHTADVVTVYAHNHENLVLAGQSVRQGEPVATVGQSGRATGHHLHFEVRHKTVPVSPWPFLSSQQHGAESGTSLHQPL